MKIIQAKRLRRRRRRSGVQEDFQLNAGGSSGNTPRVLGNYLRFIPRSQFMSYLKGEEEGYDH